ncbi:MAG TPA: M20/M25/M40 family metallo-hydrolase [Candidatus Dormibacteraeota bacterium]|nr:M20/M25/M40 family metallo-hydrolase [Candidatus Dormibacteraeota bacterium]
MRICIRRDATLVIFLLGIGTGTCLVPASAQTLQAPSGALQLKPPQGTAGCSATATSSCEQAAAKILPLVMGPSPLEGNLRRLTDEIGGRVTGTPAMKHAVEWAVAAFRSAGVDVHTEKYTMPVTWSEGATRLDVLAPMSFPVHLLSTGWSPTTPAGGIEANLVDVGHGTASEFSAGGSAAKKGAILLVHSEVSVTWADLFNEYMRAPEIIALAKRADATAILWMSARERLLLYRHTNSLDGAIDKIPQAVVAREDAMRLARWVASGQPVRVRLDLPNTIGGPAEQENVVGEIRGREKADEVVILGAHLDSWELGTGALDNGCNAALVIEAARAIAASGLLPRRTIRFVLFSGEEQGTLGSHAYVQQHAAELDKIRAMIAFDEGIGRVSGYSLGGRKDIEAGVREALKPLESWGSNHHTADAFIGTDNFDFLLEGIPNLVANQEESNYLPNYHAQSDTFDKVDIRELKLHAALAAATAWGIADRADPLGKRLSRAEVEAVLRDTSLDKQMQLLGYWKSWQDNSRGRHP